MKKKYILALGSVMLLGSQMSHGQNVLSPKTAIAISENKANGAKNTNGAKTEDRAVTAFVTINPDKTSWAELGIKPMSEAGNTATARLTLSDIDRLSKENGVEYVQLTSGVSQTLDAARKETGMDDVHNGTTLSQPYTGKGVVVGVVDAGFDYMHSAFRNPTDGTLRIKRVWEQNTSASLAGAKTPEKFGYGITDTGIGCRPEEQFTRIARNRNCRRK